MTPLQVPVPPDLGENTLFGKIGAWALGAVVAIMLFIARKWEKWMDNAEKRFETVNAALGLKVATTDHGRTRDDLALLEKQFQQMRIDSLEQHGAVLDQISLNKNEIQTTMSRNREEFKDLLNAQTSALKDAIHAVADRRAHPRDS